MDQLSKEAKDLIHKLLNVKNNKRISAGLALKHKWFKNAPDKKIEKVALQNAIENIKAQGYTSKL